MDDESGEFMEIAELVSVGRSDLPDGETGTRLSERSRELIPETMQ